MIYLIGSLRNPCVPILGHRLRTELGEEVFDDWHGNGPEADDYWQKYEKARGRDYRSALKSPIPRAIHRVDKENIDASHTVILHMPAGKSGHMEFGYAVGSGKRGYILLDGEPERYEVMYNFATDVFLSEAELVAQLKADRPVVTSTHTHLTWGVQGD